MKIIFLAISALFISTYGFCQRQEPCAFDKYMRNHTESARLAEELIQRNLAGIGHHSGVHGSHLPGLKVIPVVVHVIHNGGIENISDVQIQSQIDILNQDFRRIPGSPGFGTGVDAEIEFCLAKKDPIGKCTNGIIRIQSSLSNHQTYQRSQLKQLSYWDNTRYLNVYVVKNINNGVGILGYSSFPGGPPDEDGIVVRHDYFGNIGTAAGGMGRTTTHEIGHWFGLYHTFNGGCGTDTCTTGDMVCDTPPVSAPNFGCPTINSCTNDSYSDQVENYLDYTDDACKSKFTLGQKNRMHAALTSLRPDIWATWNIDSTGCDSGYASSGPCNVISDFVCLSRNICSGTSAQFTNRSQNSPLSFIWSFPGGTPTSSTAANPVITYPASGTFDVKLIATNSVGNDTLLIPNYITVNTPPIGQPLPYYEGFEDALFPPAGITVDNPDGGITWERDVTAKPYGGTGSAKINNLINTNYGQSDALILPGLDFTSATVPQYLFFYWAYARSDPSYSDELIVLASKDCGATWSQIFYRTGSSLATGPTQTTPYIPDNTTVWKNARINLSAYTTEKNVIFKFVNVTDGGNNLYLDNIGIGIAPMGIDVVSNQAPVVYPNPANDLLFVEKGSNNGYPLVFTLYDCTGRIISSTTKSETKFTVDIASLSPGIYLFEAKCNGVIVERNKLIKY